MQAGAKKKKVNKRGKVFKEWMVGKKEMERDFAIAQRKRSLPIMIFQESCFVYSLNPVSFWLEELFTDDLS